MKKLRRALILFFTLCILTPNASANAANLPIKDSWILKEDLIAVLRENGSLIFSNSIDSENIILSVDNVAEFYPSGVILYQNGDIATLEIKEKSYFNKHTTCKIENIATEKNVKKFFPISKFDYIYIDNNNVLKGKNSYSGEINSEIMKDVRDCYYCNNLLYAITTNDVLYSTDFSGNTKNEILSNVRDIKIANGDLLILRNNGDLYFCKKNEVPNRIGTNIENMNKVVFESTHTSGYGIEFVNKNGEYYVGTSISEFKKSADNIKDVYRFGKNIYALTNDNILYHSEHYAIDFTSNQSYKTENVEKIIGKNDYFVLKTDNKVYVNKNAWKKGNYVTENVKDIIVYDSGPGTDDDRYLFLKNDGTLYAAYGEDSYVPTKPFITSFCQKPTNVMINNTKLELTAKIQIVNNRSMYPFRECLESMGATVLWDSTNKTAIGEYNGITIEFPIGKSEYFINGVKYQMDVPSFIDDSIGRTYIPIRYAAEGLGFTVDWKENISENIISIYH
ncbi:MAG: hypothetical protein IKA17_10980 [Clostridia bacterium]|nr:hypothetical protein [Clostridia bacterium]